MMPKYFIEESCAIIVEGKSFFSKFSDSCLEVVRLDSMYDLLKSILVLKIVDVAAYHKCVLVVVDRGSHPGKFIDKVLVGFQNLF